MLRSFGSTVLRRVLAYLAASIVRTYRPTIIGITGSVGKTSAKQALAAVLANEPHVRVSRGNLNTEVGVPLTIFGVSWTPESIVSWMRALLKGWGTFFLRDLHYPKVLVLEMGADRPGDIQLLTTIAPPTIGILTAIAPVHLDRFLTVEEIAREKAWILKWLPQDGLAVVAYREDRAWGLSRLATAPVITYGIEEGAQVRASDTRYHTDTTATISRGTIFKLHYQGSTVPCLIVDVLGEAAVEAALAAAAVGFYRGMNLIEVTERLRYAHFPNGRMHLVGGIKHTVIIDDTYNSSPRAVEAALGVLGTVGKEEGRRTWATLGDMAELGSSTEQEHRRVAQWVLKHRIDRLVTVGPSARWISDEAQAMGYPPEVITKLGDAREAGRFLQNHIEAGDCILIKGSQIIRMERTVLEIMAEPEHASCLLVRQEPRWLRS